MREGLFTWRWNLTKPPVWAIRIYRLAHALWRRGWVYFPFMLCTVGSGPITIGDDAKIGAGAVVLCDVPAGWTAVGNPARLLPPKEQRHVAAAAE